MRPPHRATLLPTLLLLCAGIGGCASAGVAAGAAGVLALGSRYSENRYQISDDGPFFYHDTGEGTDAYAGPFDVLLNKGYATAQWEGRGRHIFDYPYGWGTVLRSIADPNEAIQNSGGWGRVLKNEVLPFSEEGWDTWAWVPNYYGHLFEGGIAFRRLREWYEARGVAHAGLLAGVTTWSAAFLNEAYESPGEGLTHSGIAIDLLVFDIGGILLFSTDFAPRFFATKLRGNIWPTQASLMINDGRLLNNAHHLVLKIPLGFTDRFSLFWKSGIGFEAGVAIHASDEVDVSVGVGKESRKRFIDPSTRLETAEFGPAAGLWIDRRGVLLASLLLDAHTDRLLALNVYPGVVSSLGSLGAWVAFSQSGRPAFGITSRRSMGLGLGWGF